MDAKERMAKARAAKAAKRLALQPAAEPPEKPVETAADRRRQANRLAGWPEH